MGSSQPQSTAKSTKSRDSGHINSTTFQREMEQSRLLASQAEGFRRKFGKQNLEPRNSGINKLMVMKSNTIERVVENIILTRETPKPA